MISIIPIYYRWIFELVCSLFDIFDMIVVSGVVIEEIARRMRSVGNVGEVGCQIPLRAAHSAVEFHSICKEVIRNFNAKPLRYRTGILFVCKIDKIHVSLVYGTSLEDGSVSITMRVSAMPLIWNVCPDIDGVEYLHNAFK